MSGDIITMASHFPLVIVVFEDKFTDDALRRAMADNERLLDQGRRFVTVRDVRLVRTVANASQRKMMAEWETRMAPLISANCKGVANVINSPVIAAGLRAIHWMSEPPSPEVVVPTLPEGLAWAMKRMQEEQIHVPDDVRRFVARMTASALGGPMVTPAA